MAISALPTIPFVVFAVIEPVLLIMAWSMAWLQGDALEFFAMQAPAHAVSASSFSPQALGVTLQLTNVLLLLAGLAVVCCSPWAPPAVTRGYLLAVALADYGHMYAAYAAVGPDYFWSPAGWNRATWGNIGASAVLNVLRLATVAGVFGPLREIGDRDVKGKTKAA